MKKILLITIALFISAIGYSQTFIKNNITYTVTSTSPNKVGVSGYNMAGGTAVTIPASVTQDSAGKSSIKASNVNATTYSVTSIENVAFSGKPITSVSIPNSVTTIGGGAFFNTKIASVVISENVTNIGSQAFAGNDYLSCVTSLSTTPPTLTVNSSSHSFGLIRYNITLKIPASSVSAYTNPNNGAQWTNFNNGGQPFEVGDTFTSNLIKYKIISMTNNTVVVSGNVSVGSGVVDIPATVSDCTSTYTVTEIGLGAPIFGNSSGSITSVTIPNTVSTIRSNAFGSCSLTNIIIPSSVTIIEQQAFTNNNLTSVVLSDGLTTIGDYAFGSNQLTSIRIPASVTSIGTGGFSANQNLADVYSYATTPATIVINTSNFDTFGPNRSTVNLHIPAGYTDVYVTNAGALWTGFKTVSEFFINNYITYQLTASNTVKTVDYNTDGGTSVAVPNTVTNASITYAVTAIDENSFSNNNLTIVTIENGVTTIGKSAFKNNSIETIVIPNSVTDIDDSAFENNQLETITLSDNLTEIKSYVFQNNMLISLTIPTNVTAIQKDAFQTNQLTSLTIPSNVVIIYQRAFKDNQLTNLTIENGISGIYGEVFRNNQLTTLTIPSSVSWLGNGCFLENPLTSITSIKATAPDINTDATWDTFLADRSGIDLIIPTGSMASYVTGTNAEWTGFNSVTESATLSTSNFEIEKNIKLISFDDKIEVKMSNTIQLQQYTLYTISSKKVKTGSENAISTSSLPKGIYILKLDFDKGSHTKKILIN